MITVLVRTIGVVAAGALALVAGQAILSPSVSSETAKAPAVAVAGLQRLPNGDVSVSSYLLARSPFAPDRSAFSRAPVAPPVQYDVRLMGVSRLGRELTATLMINGVQSIVREGDETPIGPVKEIKREQVEIGGAQGRVLEMFSPSAAPPPGAFPAPPAYSPSQTAPHPAASFTSPVFAPPAYPNTPSSGPSIQKTSPN
jgi:hypothetical protein